MTCSNSMAGVSWIAYKSYITELFTKAHHIENETDKSEAVPKGTRLDPKTVWGKDEAAAEYRLLS